MQTQFSRNACFAAVASATIVGFTGLLLDRSLDVTYDSALPTGTVEICEIQPFAAGGDGARNGDTQL
jgi:hypothetical protein